MADPLLTKWEAAAACEAVVGIWWCGDDACFCTQARAFIRGQMPDGGFVTIALGKGKYHSGNVQPDSTNDEVRHLAKKFRIPIRDPVPAFEWHGTRPATEDEVRRYKAAVNDRLVGRGKQPIW